MASLMLVNPRKRRKKTSTAKKRRTTSKRKLPALASSKSVTKRYRRNPIPKMGKVVDTMKDGAIGAVGAVATEVLMSKLPIPATMTTGAVGIATKALGGIALGMAVAKFGKNKSLGTTLATGAVTVALHDTIRNMVKGPMGLAGYGDGGLLGVDTLLGNDFNDLGYYSPAPAFETPAEMGYYDLDV